MRSVRLCLSVEDTEWFICRLYIYIRKTTPTHILVGFCHGASRMAMWCLSCWNETRQVIDYGAMRFWRAQITRSLKGKKLLQVSSEERRNLRLFRNTGCTVVDTKPGCFKRLFAFVKLRISRCYFSALHEKRSHTAFDTSVQLPQISTWRIVDFFRFCDERVKKVSSCSPMLSAPDVTILNSDRGLAISMASVLCCPHSRISGLW